MLDQLRDDLQHRLDGLLAEADKLRRALGAVLREPAERAKVAAGLERRARKSDGLESRRDGSA